MNPDTLATLQRLAAIRERAAKATPGPWTVVDEARRFVNAGKEHIAWSYYANDNATFIAAARADVPLLLDALADVISVLAERMRECKDCQRAVTGGCCGRHRTANAIVAAVGQQEAKRG